MNCELRVLVLEILSLTIRLRPRDFCNEMFDDGWPELTITSSMRTSNLIVSVESESRHEIFHKIIKNPTSEDIFFKRMRWGNYLLRNR